MRNVDLNMNHSFAGGPAKSGNIVKIIKYVVIAVFTAIWFLPFVWVLLTAIRSNSEVYDPVVRWIPQTITFENFAYILNDKGSPVGTWFINSLYIAAAHTFFIIVVCSLAAFAYARMEFKGKNAIFIIILSSMMIPSIMNLVPSYIIIDKLGWIDKGAAMIFPALGNAFGVFLLRQFFMGLPKELDEAGIVDGASYFRIYWEIILPLSKPALISLAIIVFLGNWNDYLWPLIVTNNVNSRTLPVGLLTFQGRYTVEYATLMAGAAVAMLPPLLLLAFGQKYFEKGIAFSGIKG